MTKLTWSKDHAACLTLASTATSLIFLFLNWLFCLYFTLLSPFLASTLRDFLALNQSHVGSFYLIWISILTTPTTFRKILLRLRCRFSFRHNHRQFLALRHFRFSVSKRVDQLLVLASEEWRVLAVLLPLAILWVVLLLMMLELVVAVVVSGHVRDDHTRAWIVKRGAVCVILWGIL